MKKYAMILVGGSGTRLWPMSRRNYPKQFVEFKDGKSLFQMTIQRLLTVFSASDIVFIAGVDHKFTIYNQIDMMTEFSVSDKKNLKNNLVLEPVARNTLPAIMLGMSFLRDKRRARYEDIVFAFPSDHIIEPVSKFKKSLEHGERAAIAGNIVVFGIKPDSPKEGFGYIIPESLKPTANSSTPVKAFVEKPDRKKAQQLIKQGAMWNAGIFCFSMCVMENEIRVLQSSQCELYQRRYEDFSAAFGNCIKDSIDYAVMQKTDKAAVVEFSPKWSDLGSWDSLMDFYSDGRKNFSIGESYLHECGDCLTYSRDRLVTMVGVDDIILVDSSDSILVMKKGESDKVKQVVEGLEVKGLPHIEDSPTVYRPWGYYTVLDDRAGYKVKEIGVYPGRALSLQKHKHRSEHWNIVQGTADVVIGNDRLVRTKNQSVYVPKNTKHKLSNNGRNVLKIIEVQIGTYLEEDDITRYETYV